MDMKKQIENFDTEDMAVFSRLSDKQLLHYYEPVKEGVFIAESPKVIQRAIAAGYEPLSVLMEDKPIDAEVQSVLDHCGDAPVYCASLELMSKLTGYPMTRGMLCAMRRKVLPTMEEICKGARRLVLIEDVMNPTNVGAIFRNAAALNMDGVLLSPGCCDPLYRRAVRVSMGTVFQVPWMRLSGSSVECLEKLKQAGYITAAMALKDNAVTPREPALKNAEKCCIVLGTEGEGLSPDTIEICDYTICIPMSHGVDSLNVAAASAVAFWELGNSY